MSEIPTNEPPHPPIVANKPLRVISPARHVINRATQPHQNLARRTLIPVTEPQLDVVSEDERG